MNKVVVIVLVLIAVVFFVFVGFGSLKSEQKPLPKDIEAPPGSETLHDLFGSLQESVSLKCDPAAPKTPALRCAKLELGVSDIAPAKESSFPFQGKTTFRTAKLVLLQGIASVTYLDRKGGDRIDNPQEFKLPNPKNEGATSESIVVMENGGKLIITCDGNASCRVGQQ